MPFILVSTVISIVLAVVSIISAIVSIVLGANAPKPPIPEDAEYESPTQEIGVPIGVLFGTRRIAKPSVVWWGDLNILKVPVAVDTKK